MNRKLLVRVVLGVLAVLLIAGMVYQFTPALSSLRGGSASSPTALTVDGTPVTDQDLEAIKRSNPILNLAQSGTLADDLKTATVDRALQNALVKNASQGVKVSRADVNTEVQKVRDQYNLKTNKQWTDALAANNLTDAGFREQMRVQLAVTRTLKQITDAAPKPTAQQLQTYYQLHQTDYKAEPRVRARVLSVKDPKQAASLLAQLKAGADFAKLAGESSLDYKDRGGAVAAVTNGQVTPVSQAALQPAEVAAAAFALTSGGLSDVVKSGDKSYIVKVEQYLPASAQPYADVKADVTKKVTDLIAAQAQQTWLDGLKKSAKVEVKEPSWAYQNPTVATVAGQNISYAELMQAVLANQQLSQLLQQAPPDQAANFVNGFFKPQVINQLIQSYAAAEVVKRDKLPLVGPRPQLLADLASYGTRSVKVSDAEVEAFYAKNKAQYQTPASAEVDVIAFTDKASALAFRQKFPADAAGVVQTAAQAGGTLTEYGSVKQGEQDAQTQQPKLNPVLDKAIFAAGRLQPAGDGSVSDVVEVSGRSSIAWVHDLVPANTTPLAQVRAQVSEAALQEKLTTAKTAYVESQTKGVKVVNNLQKVLAAQQARVAAAEASSTKGTSATGSSATGTSATSGASATGTSASSSQ